MDPILSQ